MKKLFQIFSWGMIISFLGSLPLGVMNLTATHIAIQQGIRAGIIYASGSMVVEIIVVRVTLVGMGWLARRHKIFFFLELITTGLLFVVAMASIIAAYKMREFSNSLPTESLHPFFTGVLLSLTNPLHIPFWMGWSTLLLNKQILEPQPIQYNWFVSGIGTGTILGFMVFILGGPYFISQITQHQNLLNWVIGIVLMGTFVIQAKKIIFVPTTVRYSKMLSRNINKSYKEKY